MRKATLFVILQFIIGFAFAATGVFFFTESSNLDLFAGILYAYLIGLFGMLLGVGLVGYFHLRLNHILERFGLALTLIFVGSLVFSVLYVLIGNYLPKQFGVLVLILPLTGAVFGFNFVATKYSESP